MEERVSIRALVNKLAILALCLICCGCGQKANKEFSLRKDNPQKEYSRNSFHPDTTINNCLKLKDYNTVDSFYTDLDKLEFTEMIRDGTPIIIFANKDKSQYLLASNYEGDVVYSFSQFEIGYWNKEKFDKYKYYKTNHSFFFTESDIKLGISLDSLLKIKGTSCQYNIIDNDTIIVYQIDDISKSCFLKKYNMPSYFMKYEIKDNVVRQILFGFDYP